MRVTLVIDDRLGPPVICQSMDVNDQELERISDGMYVKVSRKPSDFSYSVERTP